MSMLVRPMLCEIGELSILDAREGDPDWIVERKYDGERIVAQYEPGKVHLWTRRVMNVSH
jgi:ATP-dependent DNA ligase